MDAPAQDRALRTGVGYHVPADVGFVEVAGPDARSFLQNLGTNDVKNLSPGHGVETFFTTHKARTVGHAVVWLRDAETILLTVESGLGEAMLKHLDHYLISEQVELSRPEWGLLRILGPGADEVVRARWPEAAGLSAWQGVAAGAGVVRRQAALHVPGFEILGSTIDIAALADELARQNVTPLDAAAIEPVRIESGWPRWGHEMDENRFVVEIDRIGQAISYAKGCYLGQEPIVMARDRGQANRRLMGLRCLGDLPIGSTRRSGEIEDVRVTSSAFSPAWGQTVALAFIHRTAQKPGETFLIPTPAGDREAIVSTLPMIPAR